MKYATIPETDLRPSALCLGTNRFGSVIDHESAFALLDAFVDLGGSFIDTAHVYADWIPGAPKSASEKTIGRWLKARGARDQVILATKGGHPALSNMKASRLSKEDIVRDVYESLEHLQTDWIDLYWLHRDDPSVPVGGMLETLNELATAGKIRYFGCSNWRLPRIREALEYSRRHGLGGFVANQPLWSLALPNQAALSDPDNLVVFDDECYDFHLKTRLAVVAYSSQGQGFFDKLNQLGPAGLQEGDRRRYYNDTNVARFAQVQVLARQHATSPGVIALSYLLSQPFVTIPIIGPRTIEQVRDSAKAVALTLTAGELGALRQADSLHADSTR